ncbi:MAG: pitrilysin family protein [Candidatus Poribacteria bacterium]|nr:pitrilysin family protein [Candidatus Poribacteria bacterium]
MNRMKRALFLLIGFAVLLTAATAQVPLLDGLEYPSVDFEPPKPEKVVLDNGMTLYLLEDHELPVFGMSAYIRTGDIYEPKDKIGLAGLMATVMRTGGTVSMEPDALNETLEFLAASVESGMSAENASVGLSAMSKDIDTVLTIFADVVINPAFREDKLELARNQAVEGIRRQNDNPAQIASRELHKAVYGDHPYANTATAATLSAITRDDLIAFHKAYYRPANMLVAVSGDFERDAIIAKISEAFAGWNPSGEEVAPIPPVEEGDYAGVYHAEKDLPQVTVYFGHLGVTRTNPDWFPILVLNEILGGSGFTSRLMREVRTNLGLTYGVGTVFRRSTERGMFLGGSSSRSETAVQAMQAIKAIMEGIRAEPVTDQEIDIIKNSEINSFVFSYTSSAAIAEQALRLDYFGYPSDYLDTYTDKVAAVTKDDVLRVAQEYLHPDKLAIITVGKRAALTEPLESLGEVTTLDLTTGTDQ